MKVIVDFDNNSNVLYIRKEENYQPGYCAECDFDCYLIYELDRYDNSIVGLTIIDPKHFSLDYWIENKDAWNVPIDLIIAASNWMIDNKCVHHENCEKFKLFAINSPQYWHCGDDK
jgi:hypothetical protein